VWHTPPSSALVFGPIRRDQVILCCGRVWDNHREEKMEEYCHGQDFVQTCSLEIWRSLKVVNDYRAGYPIGGAANKGNILEETNAF
jgi:hypothetical protein